MTVTYINYRIPLTLDQAQDIVDARSNGSFDHDAQGNLSPAGEWCLAELEALTVKLRFERNEPHVCQPIAYSATGEEIWPKAPRDPLFGYTAALAKDCVDAFLQEKDKRNPTLAGVSASKGGRAWIDGHWTVSQLESLCARLRFLAGDGADGAIETLANDLYLEHTNFYEVQSEEDAQATQALYPFFKKMLYAGINPAVFPRVWNKFIEHDTRRWSLPRIVCAANQYAIIDTAGQVKRVTLPSPRHSGRIMADLMGLIGLHNGNRDPELLQPYLNTDQGFIDQHDNYYTREEAWVIATYHNQITRNSHWREGTLCSENLY